MKVVMVMSNPMPPREGIGNHVYNISRRLVARGHEVTIVTRGSWRGGSSFNLDGIRVYRVRFYPTYPFHVHLHGLFVNALLRRISQPDILHLHTPLVPPVKVSAPVITTVHTPMLVDSRYVEPVNALGLAIKLQAPISVQLEKALFRRSSLVTTVSRSIADELRSYELQPGSIAVTGNGVDHELFCPIPHQPRSGRYVLTVGRLAYRKGLFDVIRCAAQVAELHPEVGFILVGEGPMESNIRSLVTKLGLQSKVKFLGHLGYQSPQLIKLYQGCSVYLQASHYEGLPGSLLEAMACGRPIVATAISSHSEVISSGQNGVLVPPGSPEKLAQAVCTLLENRPMAQGLGAAARCSIEEGYTWDKVTDRLLDCYDRVVNMGNRY